MARCSARRPSIRKSSLGSMEAKVRADDSPAKRPAATAVHHAQGSRRQVPQVSATLSRATTAQQTAPAAPETSDPKKGKT